MREEETVPVQLNGWVDCPGCGKFLKLSRVFRLPEAMAGPMQLKVRCRCEQCGRAAAFLYLDRTLLTMH